MAKKKSKSVHEKAIERMQRETNRAIAHVKFLEQLYLESLKTRRK